MHKEIFSKEQLALLPLVKGFAVPDRVIEKELIKFSLED